MPVRAGRVARAARRGAPCILSHEGRLAAINDLQVGRDHAALFAAVAPDAWRRFSPTGGRAVGARRTWHLHLALIDALGATAPMLDEHALLREAQEEMNSFLDDLHEQVADEDNEMDVGCRIVGEWQFQPFWYHSVPVRLGAYHYAMDGADEADDEPRPAIEDALALLVNRRIACYGHTIRGDGPGRDIDERLAAALPCPLGEAVRAMIVPPPDDRRQMPPDGGGGASRAEASRRYRDDFDVWSAWFDRRAAAVLLALAEEGARGRAPHPDLALFARWVACDANLAAEFAATPDPRVRGGAARTPDDNPYLLDPEEVCRWDVDYDWDIGSLRALARHAERGRDLRRRVLAVRAAVGTGGDPAAREGVARSLRAALALADADGEATRAGAGRGAGGRAS